MINLIQNFKQKQQQKPGWIIDFPAKQKKISHKINNSL